MKSGNHRRIATVHRVESVCFLVSLPRASYQSSSLPRLPVSISAGCRAGVVLSEEEQTRSSCKPSRELLGIVQFPHWLLVHLVHASYACFCSFVDHFKLLASSIGVCLPPETTQQTPMIVHPPVHCCLHSSRRELSWP